MAYGMDEFLKELPKCEHHVHLEGTLSPELFLELASKNKVELPSGHPSTAESLYKRYDEFTGLQDFLDHYYIGMSVLKTSQDFEDLAYRYFLKAKADGVHHAEVFFDPQAHLERGLAFEVFVTGFDRARKRAQSELNISTKLIMCLLRHLPVADGVDTVHLARPHMESQLIDGVGLCSSEQNQPPAKFKDIYDTARSFGIEHLRYTAHAGEEGGADYVQGAMDHLGVERIDHGVRSVEDKKVLQTLRNNKTLLTVCPVSNLKLRGVDNIGKLPLQVFLDNDIPFSINSDDPAYFGAYILDNYRAVQEHFGFDPDTWVKIASNSIEGSWITDSRKKEILEAVAAARGKLN